MTMEYSIADEGSENEKADQTDRGEIDIGVD